MAQGWNIDAGADTITFLEPPPAGTNNIVVTEYAPGAKGGTDVWAVGAWSHRYGFPGEVEFFADRLWFAGTPADPQTIWASNIGDYNNFGRSSPIVDSDAVSFTINAREVNAVRDLVPLDNLIVLTVSGAMKVTGGQDDVITPSTIGVKPQAYHGVANIPARVIGDSAIMIEGQGSKIRDLAYVFEKDGFRGNEISIWADHLTNGYTFRGVDKSSAPWPVLWLPRNDGALIGCTYMPEQEVVGWHRHETDGKILDVCCLPDEDETKIYVLVERVIDGEVCQYIEQMAPTRYASAFDWKYLDSMLTYDGRNTTATTITLSTSSGWTEDAELTATASGSLFSGSGDVGDILLVQNGDDSVRVVIDEYVSATVVKGHSIGTVPDSLRNTARATWTFQRDTITGLSHLEGKTVAALVDGSVQRDLVVSGGQVALQRPGGVVQIGLPYTSHVETLEINAPGGDSMRAMKKLVYEVSLQVLGTRGLLVGTRLDQMDPIAQREFEDYDEPTNAKTGVFTKNITAQWGQDCGHFHVLSEDPLPMELLALIPRVAASD